MAEDNLRRQFADCYSRMCYEAAIATLGGINTEKIRHVLNSPPAELITTERSLSRIAIRRRNAHRFIKLAHDAGIDFELLTADAARARRTVEAEFMVSLPIGERHARP